MGEYAAIPTVYKGIQFRSRLEATWAVFFSNLKWPWAYEPLELQGYIPDFLLHFPHGPVLVEVKPAATLEELHPYTAKIVASGWEREALIVGVQPGISLGDLVPTLGLAWGPEPGTWGRAVLHRCLHCGSPSYYHEEGRWYCRVSGCYDGNAFIGAFDHGEPIHWWATAQNATQYKAVR